MTGYCDKNHVPIIWDDPFEMSPCPLCLLGQILAEVREDVKYVNRQAIEISMERDKLARNLDVHEGLE